MATQWRAGPGGLIGLDYGPAITLIQGRGYQLELSLELLRAIEVGHLKKDEAGER